MEEKEKELDIKDMIFRTLEKWRWMLVWAVVMAVALAGLKYLKDMRDFHDGEDTDGTLSIAMENMSPSERSNVQIYITLYDKLEMLRNDTNTRLIYQIDPYHEKAFWISYAVKLPKIEESSGEYIIAQHMDDETKINQLVAMYGNYVMSSDFIDEIVKAVPEIAESDLRTLISIVDINTNTDTNTDTNTNTNGIVNIKIIYTDDMDIDAIAEIVKDNIEMYSKVLKEEEEHSIVFGGEYCSEIIDYSLINAQNNLISSEYNLQNQMNSIEKSLEENEKMYVEAYIDGEKEDDLEEKNNNKQYSTDISIKFAVIGAVLGVFIVCFIEFMKYVLSGKLHTVDLLSDYYELQVFGVQSMEDKLFKKKGIDKLLYRLENGKRKLLAPEAQKEIIESGINLYCVQKGINELVLTGTDIERIDENYIKEIVDGLTRSGIKTSVEKNIYYYPNALKKASEIKNVILMEILNSSIEDEIENMLIKAHEYDINILGVVVCEVA